MTGHYDTKIMADRVFVGANDGGSSTGFLLEMARLFCAESLAKKTFIWFGWTARKPSRTGRRDDSLYGSRHLAKRWQEDGTLARIKAMINVDMIGDADLTMVHEWNSTPWLRKLVWETAEALGYAAAFFNAGRRDRRRPYSIPSGRRSRPGLDRFRIRSAEQPGGTRSRTQSTSCLPQSFQVIGNVLLKVLAKLEN